MTAVWDGDTGTITIVASTSSGPVNLSASDSRAVIVRNDDTDVSTELTITSEDLAAGTVVASAQALEVGGYKAVLRVVTGSTTVTYPSADKGPEVLTVLADLDATD